jgi:hypothetical protein
MIKETRGRAVVVEMMMMMMMPDESVPIESQPTATTTTTSPDYRREKYEKKKRKENECNSALHKSRRILCDARLSLSLSVPSSMYHRKRTVKRHKSLEQPVHNDGSS